MAACFSWVCCYADFSEGLKMETYISFMFWMGIFSAAIRVLIIGFADYPRVETPKTVGYDLFLFIIGGLFTIWAGLLNYGLL
jgi:hypothetical protein